MVRRLFLFSISNILEPRFRKFLAVGAFGTAIDFLLFYIGYNLCGLAVIPANIISYGTGITCSFFIHRLYTFHDGRKKSKRRLALSLIFGYTGLLLNTALVWAIALFLPVWTGKVVAVGVILFYNYLTNKYIVFAAHDV